MHKHRAARMPEMLQIELWVEETKMPGCEITEMPGCEITKMPRLFEMWLWSMRMLHVLFMQMQVRKLLLVIFDIVLGYTFG